MTNKFNNWERLVKVIERFGLSINSFALSLGLGRSENLYHIRRGNYGISEDLANRIISADPDIDRTWLLSGIGNMLKSDPVNCDRLPFYRDEMESILSYLDNYEPSDYIQTPYATGSDFVVRSFSRPMSDPVTAANDLFLKRLSGVYEVVQGNEHVLLVGDRVVWRMVRYIKDDPTKWRLVSRNRENFPDIIIDVKDVKAAWRVIARIAILES
jgi:hypothetical protein